MRPVNSWRPRPAPDGPLQTVGGLRAPAFSTAGDPGARFADADEPLCGPGSRGIEPRT